MENESVGGICGDFALMQVFCLASRAITDLCKQAAIFDRFIDVAQDGDGYNVHVVKAHPRYLGLGHELAALKSEELM